MTDPLARIIAAIDPVGKDPAGSMVVMVDMGDLGKMKFLAHPGVPRGTAYVVPEWMTAGSIEFKGVMDANSGVIAKLLGVPILDAGRTIRLDGRRPARLTTGSRLSGVSRAEWRRRLRINTALRRCRRRHGVPAKTSKFFYVTNRAHVDLYQAGRIRIEPRTTRLEKEFRTYRPPMI